MTQETNGSWDLAADFEERLIYVFGDCKSNDNYLNFVRQMQTRKLSHDQTQAQAEVFLKAMSRVIEGPGDWHAGQAILQSMFTLFYGGLLQPIQVALGWKRIGDQVKDCYYGASRLLLFVLTEVERLFLDMLLTKLGASFREKHANSDMAGTLALTSEFKKMVEELLECDDEWQRYLAHFYMLGREFRSFCTSCREGDSIAVEHLYAAWGPIWKELGQHRYTEVTFRQIETLYERIKFSTLQEMRGNRYVRMYAKRRCMSTDEFVELVNKWMKDLATCKTAETWAEQTKMLGVMRRCVHFIKATYTQSPDEFDATPKSSTPPTMTPEKQLIYEILVRSCVHIYIPRRTMDLKIIFDILKDCTTDLKRSNLASERTTSDPMVEDLVSAVAQISENDVAVDCDLDVGEFASFTQTNLDEVLAQADTPAETVESESNTIMNDGTKVRKRPLNRKALKITRMEGINKLKKGEIVKVRKKAAARHDRSVTAMREMHQHVADMSTQVEETETSTDHVDKDVQIWWRQQVKFARSKSKKTTVV
jgi:hypothetical protein